MNSNNNQKLKNIQIEIFKSFLNICHKYNLRYFLLGGSTLGAIRHKGFIPWDDDIDVGLPRSDYMKFLDIAQSELPENLFLQTTETDPLYIHNFAKIRHSETTFIETATSHLRINHGVYMDVFPLDGFPTKKYKQKEVLFKNSMFRRSISNLFNIERKNIGLRESFLFSLATFIWRNPYKTIQKREKLMRAIPYENGDFIANFCGAWAEKEIMPKSYFGNGTKAFFEGIEVCIPEKYDLYLKKLYGDYMTPPPEDKRISHHYCTVIDTEKSYRKYI